MSVWSRPAAEFSIWTREAGAGGLSIAVEGPSKAEITFEDRKDGSCGVSYVVQEPGESADHKGTYEEPLWNLWVTFHQRSVRGTFHQINLPFIGTSENLWIYIPSEELQLPSPLSPGDYEVSIKFNDEHVPDSPFVVPVATLSDDARRLTIASLQVVPLPPGSPQRCMVVVVYVMFLLSCRRRP